MAAEPVPMLLANNVVLRSPFLGTAVHGRFLPADDKILRENYIPHWGRVFVAGKVIARGERPLAIAIAVPGRYAVEGGGIAIDGRYYAAGSVVTLARGTHSVAGRREAEATLRWGDHLARPAFAWPKQSYYSKY